MLRFLRFHSILSPKVISFKTIAPFSNSKSTIFWCISIAWASILRFSPVYPTSLKVSIGGLTGTSHWACLQKNHHLFPNVWWLLFQFKVPPIHSSTHATNLGSILGSTFCILYNQTPPPIVLFKHNKTTKQSTSCPLHHAASATSLVYTTFSLDTANAT